MGAIIVLVMTNGLIRLGYGTGTNQMVLGLHAGGGGDPRHPLAEEPPQGAERGLCRADLSPHGRDAIGACPAQARPMRSTTGCRNADYIGLGELEGPEDVILDRDDHLYCGTRHGEIVRFFAPDYKQLGSLRPYRRLPAGPRPSTRQATCSAASAPWGSIPSRKIGEVKQLSAETTRSWTSIVDDARLRDPNDCDVAPDGRIYLHRFHHAL